jgi:RNA 3'-terminal phosphate cyclase (ATP)
VQVAPAARLAALRLEAAGQPQRVWGIALASHLADRQVSGRMADAARHVLTRKGLDAPIDIVDDTTAAQPGAAFAVFAELTGGARLGADGAGAPRRPAERIGRQATQELLDDLAVGATVDRHAADQLLIFTALADGVSTFRAPAVTGHMQSAAWLASLFLGASVDLADDGAVTVKGAGR